MLYQQFFRYAIRDIIFDLNASIYPTIMPYVETVTKMRFSLYHTAVRKLMTSQFSKFLKLQPADTFYTAANTVYLNKPSTFL